MKKVERPCSCASILCEGCGIGRRKLVHVDHKKAIPPKRVFTIFTKLKCHLKSFPPSKILLCSSVDVASADPYPYNSDR